MYIVAYTKIIFHFHPFCIHFHIATQNVILMFFFHTIRNDMLPRRLRQNKIFMLIIDSSINLRPQQGGYNNGIKKKLDTFKVQPKNIGDE